MHHRGQGRSAGDDEPDCNDRSAGCQSQTSLREGISHVLRTVQPQVSLSSTIVISLPSAFLLANSLPNSPLHHRQKEPRARCISTAPGRHTPGIAAPLNQSKTSARGVVTKAFQLPGGTKFSSAVQHLCLDSTRGPLVRPLAHILSYVCR